MAPRDPIPPTDDDLMARLASGERGALEEIVGRWQAPVLRFLSRALGDPDEAADLAQETFLRVYRGAPSYAASGRFKSWLFRIAGNLARNEIRRRRVRRILSLEPLLARPEEIAEPLLGGTPGPDQRLETARLVESLGKALLKLPERQRLAVVLCRMEGMSQQEAADVIGTSPSAVEGLLWRGTTRLRGLLRSWLEPPD